MANSFLSFIKRDSTKCIRPVLRRASLLCLMVTALLISGFALPQAVSARDSAANRHWVGTWSTSPQTQEAFLSPPPAPPSVDDETLRQIVRITIGGDRLRVRLSNSLGTVPLVIDAASIGIRDEDAKVLPGSLRELTFGGDSFVTIAPGARVLSDPVELSVADEADLAVSLYVAENTEVTTLHNLAWQTSFISEPGDFTDVADMPVGDTFTSWYWLTGVEVWAHRNTRAVVPVGNSITEGCCSDSFVDANVRYPDELARRLLARYRGQPRVAVLNAGISGNRVLNDVIGPNAQARLDRDVLTQSGVTHVILLEGVNDLGLPFFLGSAEVSAEEIIAGYKQIIERVHARGLKILVGTILPFKAFAYWSPAREAERQMVNEWIRTSNMADGVVDFDAALRDPTDPEMLLPEFDSGDNLHPSAAGYERMGAAAEKALLAPGRGRIKGP